MVRATFPVLLSLWGPRSVRGFPSRDEGRVTSAEIHRGNALAGAVPCPSRHGIEVRSRDRSPITSGKLPYKALAVLADRGKVRKETILPGAFSYALDDPKQDIHYSSGIRMTAQLRRNFRGIVTLITDNN